MTSGHHTVSGLTAHLYELFDIQQYKTNLENQTKVSYYKQIYIRPSIYSQKEVKLNIPNKSDQ